MPSFFSKFKRKSGSGADSFAKSKTDLTSPSTTSTLDARTARFESATGPAPSASSGTPLPPAPAPVSASRAQGPAIIDRSLDAPPRNVDPSNRFSQGQGAAAAPAAGPVTPVKDASSRRDASYSEAGPSRPLAKHSGHQSRPSLDVDDIPPRTTSLHESSVPGTPSRQSVTADRGKHLPTQPNMLQDSGAERLTRDGAQGTAALQSQLQNLSLGGGERSIPRDTSAPQLPPINLHSEPLVTDLTPASSAPKTAVTDAKRVDAIAASNLPALNQQRDALVSEIASAAKARKAEAGGLSEAGKRVFAAAGLQKEAATGGSLEVETRWIEPVVQERILIKEHTETTTVIDQHIHRHHVYPKIQPISDPNPIQLQPRHRIFSALDGKWHEVVGDAAAIAILGEDVFYNGKKEVRETRQMALPGLGGELNEDQDYSRRVIEREGVQGAEMGTWHALRSDMTEVLQTGEVATPGRMIGEGWMMPEEKLGPVQKTVGIAL